MFVKFDLHISPFTTVNLKQTLGAESSFNFYNVDLLRHATDQSEQNDLTQKNVNTSIWSQCHVLERDIL